MIRMTEVWVVMGEWPRRPRGRGAKKCRRTWGPLRLRKLEGDEGQATARRLSAAADFRLRLTETILLTPGSCMVTP